MRARMSRPTSSVVRVVEPSSSMSASTAVWIFLAASSKLSDYYLFYAEDKVGYTESALYSTDINRHNVALTLGLGRDILARM